MRSWSIVDFVLVWLGGQLGAGVFLGLGESLDAGAWLLMVSLVGQYAGFTVTIWLVSRTKSDPDLGLRIEPGDFAFIALGLFLQLVLALGVQPLAELLLPEGVQPQGVIQELLETPESTSLRIALFGALVLLTPIFEELLYRGVLLKALAGIGRVPAIVLSALLFAGLHALDLDFEHFLASAVVVLPSIFILGLLLAWITIRRGRLGPAIFLHSGWNLVAAIVVLVPGDLLEGVS